jgi:hypothetical protein
MFRQTLQAQPEEHLILSDPPWFVMPLLILSAGRDAVLLDTRNRVMRSAGHIVVAALDHASLVESFLNGDFDVLVLCHSIPLAERKQVAALARTHSPLTPVLMVSDADGPPLPFGKTVANEPVTLLNELRRAEQTLSP